MSGAIKVGATITVLSAIGAIASLWAFIAYPDQWGDANVVGGWVQLITIVGVMFGLVLSVVGVLMDRRRSRDRS